MRSLWAVARHGFAQCLRMKVAGLFIVLLAVALGSMPFIMTADETLAGRTRTFFAYGVGLTSLLLSLVTIFVSVGVVSSDVRTKQIFTVATKPLARWQYIIGRWGGVVLLDAVLLAVAAGAIYGLGQYLRGGQALNADDRRTVETEVFTARKRVRPDPIEHQIQAAVARRIRTMKAQGQYEDALEAFLRQIEADRPQALVALQEELYKQESEKVQSAGPGRSIRWRFSGINVAGRRSGGLGRVTEINSSAGLMRIEAKKTLLGRLVFGGPVEINARPARVEDLGAEFFVARFAPDDMARPPIARLSAGSEVNIVIAPTVQITYKVSPTGSIRGKTLYSTWEVFNRQTGFLYYESRTDPPRLPATLTVSARLIDSDGRTELRYINRSNRSGAPGTSVMIPHDEIAVLYRVGSFEANFGRAILLVGLQLMFLAAVGILAGSFLSFPVGCLICFVVLPFSLARGFLLEAVKLPTRPGKEADWFTWLGHGVFWVMDKLLPDFARTSPVDALVDGMNITWKFLGETAGITIAVRVLLVLVAACVIFHRRELARVQV